MLLAIPYVKNATDYTNLLSAIEKQGPCASHNLIVVSSDGDAEDAYKFAEGLKNVFGSVKSIALKVGPRNATRLANDLFAISCEYMRKYKAVRGEVPDQPMLYFDPSFRPYATKWLSDLQAEFYAKGVPDSLGWFVDDEQMSPIPTGPLVISTEFVKKSALMEYLNDKIHWRKYLKGEFRSGVTTTMIGKSTSSIIRPAATPTSKK